MLSAAFARMSALDAPICTSNFPASTAYAFFRSS
jgi:hypothetical protein